MDELLAILKVRFEENRHRHADVNWEDVIIKLKSNPEKLDSLSKMELTGGEPDVIVYDAQKSEFLFVDCSAETPKGRRSVCYDREALEGRKDFPPETSAIDMAKDMGIEILDEYHYRLLQSTGEYDKKTSSWIKTPEKIRALGGALFADYRYKTVFIYHNGASSYYAVRGFRGILRV